MLQFEICPHVRRARAQDQLHLDGGTTTFIVRGKFHRAEWDLKFIFLELDSDDPIPAIRQVPQPNECIVAMSIDGTFIPVPSEAYQDH